MTDWRPLYRLAEQQHRVIARKQLDDLDVPISTVHRRAAHEGWAHPYPGVWVLPGAVTDRLTIASAATAYLGAPVALARRWAAWLHGLVQLPPSRVQVVVPHQRRGPDHERIEVLRSRTLDETDLQHVEGLPVTSVPRTMLDLAAVSDRAALRSLLITARQRRLVDLSDVVARTLLVGPVAGRGRLLRVCAELAPEVVDSVFELEVRGRLAQDGYTPDPAPAVVSTHVGPLQVDIPFASRGVGIECDGFGFHARTDELDRDSRKHNALQLAGWTVLRLTWTRMEEDWPGFLAELDRALHLRRP